MEDTENELIRKRINPRKQPIKCPICTDTRLQFEMYHAKLWFEKLLFLLAALYKSLISLKSVQALYSEISPFFVCPEHTLETSSTLLSMLEVELPCQVPQANRESVDAAMEMVLSFQTGQECLPIVSNWHFLQLVLNFVVKHPVRETQLPASGRPIYRPRHPRPAPPGQDNRFRCRICEEVKPSKDLKHMTLQDEKMLILVVAMCRNELPVPVARHLYAIQKVLACRVHLEESCNELKAMLGVHDGSEISGKLYSVESRNTLEVANYLLAEPMSEQIFLRQMQEICQSFCDHAKRSKLLPARVSPKPMVLDVYQLLCEPDDMEVAREEVIGYDDTDEWEATWNERRMEMLKAEEMVEEDVFVDVESVEDVAIPKAVELEAPPTLKPMEQPVLQTCHICEKPSNDVQSVSLRSEKICLLLVAVHRNDVSAHAARALHANPVLNVCLEHFVGSCRDLFTMMKLVHPMGVPADKEVLEKVINLADFIRNLQKPLKDHVFIHLCREYWQKYGGERDVAPKKESGEAIESCRLCGAIRRKSEVRAVSVLSEKMIVLITEVFKGTMSKGLARQYFHQLRELTLCQWHLHDVCKTLCTMFNVPRPEHFHYPKETIVTNAMFLVNVIQKGKHPFATADGKHLVRQCQRFTNKYWRTARK